MHQFHDALVSFAERREIIMGLYYKDGLSEAEKKNEVNKKLGISVKTVRKKNGMTQKELSEFLELRGGKTFISQMENGRRSLPSNVLPIIAEKGDRTVESLFRDYVFNEDNLFSKCLYLMNINAEYYSLIMNYINNKVNIAIDNIGAVKLFDIMYSVIQNASDKGYTIGKITDEVKNCENRDYEQYNHSKYINYIEEMSVYTEKK